MKINIDLLNETSNTLINAGVGFGIYSGFHAVLLAGHRSTNDVDIWVDEKKFKLLCQMFPKATLKTLGDENGYGDPESFALTLGDGSVSLMGATIFRNRGLSCPAGFDSVRDRVSWQDFGIVASYFVDPADTLLAKALMGRGADEGKNDLEDITQIASSTEIDKTYLLKRVYDLNAQDRVIPLLQKLSVLP